jgi:hypothetical protein
VSSASGQQDDRGVSVSEFGPDDTWPSHQKPYWKVALKQARTAGWTLRYLGSSHWFGVVVCPAGEHTFGVDSTARGAETIAAEVPKLLRDCPHGAVRPDGSKVAQRRAESERLLRRAEELVDMAGADLGRAEAREAARAELDRLELLLDTAQLTVDEGLLIAQDEALDRAAELDDAPGPKVVMATLDEAQDTTEAAVAIAVRIRRAPVAGPLLARAARVRQRIAGLRARLDDLQ